MDSTSIVCMSDHIRRSVDASAKILDTISFYDDSEPNHNDKVYFSLAEASRGKVGLHVQLSFTDRTFEPHDSSKGAYHLPGADSSAVVREKKIQTVVGEHVFRAILSGVGGDEVLGGVPSALPELATYLISGRLGMLIMRAMEWSLADRETLAGQLIEVAKYSLNLYRPRDIEKATIPPWLQRNVQTRCLDIARRDLTRVTRLGLTPSEISNGLAWWSIVETLPHSFPSLLERPEYRYPYLDRDLIDYLFSIPSEQLIRPGRRRSLMRRSLKNVVPEEILERRRKAYQIRGPLFALQHAQKKIHELFAESALADYGFIEPARLLSAFDSTTQGVDARWWQTLMRSISLELWLRSKARQAKPVCTPSIKNTVLPMHL
jgi:asparagine synthase (glutamine-hydrolysing)